MNSGKFGAEKANESKLSQNCAAELVVPGASPDADPVGATANDQGQNNMRYGNSVWQLPMKWHFFLVFFGFWASALCNLILGIRTLSGSQYGSYKKMIYLLLPSLKSIDIFSASAMLICSAIGFVTALWFLKMKKGALILLTLTYLLTALCYLFYCIAVSRVFLLNDMNASGIVVKGIGAGLGYLIWLLINWFYYKKRKHLFVN